MSNRKKLEVAKEFIEAKQYEIARTILEALPEDQTAKRWLIKLNDIAPKPPSTSEMTSEDLVLNITDKEVFGELMFRILELCNSYVYGKFDLEGKNAIEELKNIVDILCQVLTQDKQVKRTLHNVSATQQCLYALHAILANAVRPDIHFKQVGQLLQHAIYDVKGFAIQLLSRYNDLEAQKLLLASQDAQQPLPPGSVKIVEHTLPRNVQTYVACEILLEQNQQDLLGINIVGSRSKTSKSFDYHVACPQELLQEQFLRFVPVMVQCALQAQEWLDMSEQVREDNEDAELAYQEYFAPYEEDFESLDDDDLDFLDDIDDDYYLDEDDYDDD